jgi:hypothetical protein
MSIVAAGRVFVTREKNLAGWSRIPARRPDQNQPLGSRLDPRSSSEVNRANARAKKVRSMARLQEAAARGRDGWREPL